MKHFSEFLPCVCNIRRLRLLLRPFPKLFTENAPKLEIASALPSFQGHVLIPFVCYLCWGFQTFCSLRLPSAAVAVPAPSFVLDTETMKKLCWSTRWMCSHKQGDAKLMHKMQDKRKNSVRYPTIAKCIQRSKSYFYNMKKGFKLLGMFWGLSYRKSERMLVDCEQVSNQNVYWILSPAGELCSTKQYRSSWA